MMVCIVSKDEITRKLEDALEAARQQEERAAEQRRSIESLLRQRGFAPQSASQPASQGRKPKGRMSGRKAVEYLLGKYGEMTSDELFRLSREECGVVSESSDPKNVHQSLLKRLVLSGKIEQAGGQGTPYRLADK